MASGLLALAAGVAGAQEAAGTGTPRGLVFKPRVSVSETYTDNNLLSSTQRDATLISTLSPGISIVANGGSVTGTLDYSLSGIAYTKSEQVDRLQQTLNAHGRADFVPQVFFVDVLANISQQNGSAVGTLSADPNLGYQNRVEIQTLTIAPTLRSHIGSLATLQIQGTASGTNTVDSMIGDSRQLAGSARLDGLNPGRLRPWAMLTATQLHYKSSSVNSGDVQAMVGLRYQPDVDFFMTGDVGREHSNYVGGTGQYENTSLYGASISWTPTPRTIVSLDWQNHSYGDSHSIRLEHRMSRSVWRYSDSQSITQSTQLGSANLGSNYDLLFLEYASVEPDPVKRDLLVRNLLQNLGLNPNSQIVIGFLSNVPILSRNRQAAFALEGVRTTLTVSFSQNISRQVGVNAQTAGDLSKFGQINQHGFNLSVAHRLTPMSSVNAAFSVTRSAGLDPVTLAGSNTLRTFNLGWNGRLGPTSVVTLGARHAQEEGSNPYRENAVVATFLQNF